MRGSPSKLGPTDRNLPKLNFFRSILQREITFLLMQLLLNYSAYLH